MTRALKICRLSWDYPARGIGTYGLQAVFVNLSREQVRQGHEVHVIAPMVKSLSREENDFGVKVHRVKAPYGLSALRKMRELSGGSSDDWVVHAHATSGFILSPLKYLRRKRVFAHVHGTSKRRLVGSEMTRGDSRAGGVSVQFVRLARE